MLWLIAQMWLLLFSAFALGLAVGWWIWRAPNRAVKREETRRGAPVVTGTLDTEEKEAAPVRRRAGATASGRREEWDDLTQIDGVDATMEKTLNRLGVYYLYQVADWGPARIRWIEEKIGQSGRVEREGWVAQARSLRLQTQYELS